MHHYAYLLTFNNGMKYVGARSGKVKPHLDTTYLGSGRALPKDRHDNRHLVDKQILAVFNNRKDLIDYESNYITTNNCIESNEYYNLRNHNYDKQGKGHNSAGFTKASHRKGMATVRRRNYTKKGNRTPAQLAHDKRCSENFTGVTNPDKGHKGITNSAFVPWYYIDPLGNYVEVHDTTKKDKALELGFTLRQLTQGFSKLNEHQKSRTLPRKGWTFGNLPKP